MPRELQPELHDIFKLTKLGHIYKPSEIPSAYPIPRNHTWDGILSHHCDTNWEFFPHSLDTLCLNLADHLAAATSRGVTKDIKVSDYRFEVYKLWNPKEHKDPRIMDGEGIKNIFSFCQVDPDTNVFFSHREYGPLLRQRSEDANPLRCISSLYSHSKLTGQFYRILKSHSGLTLHDTEFAGAITRKEILTKFIKPLEEKMLRLWVIRCKISFPQQPIRAKDLNIFSLREKLINDFSSQYSDNVLMQSSDELLLVSPDLSILDKFSELQPKLNFRISVVAKEHFLKQILPDPEEKWEKGYKEQQTVKYISSPVEIIYPPLCEICQMAQGVPHDPEGDNPVENLCDSCYEVRKKGNVLNKFADWKNESGIKALWIKLSLDISQLNQTLNDLYFSFVNQYDSTIPKDKAQIRFSVITEFQADYEQFIAEFKNKLYSTFSTDNIQSVLRDFYVLRIENTSRIIDILSIYFELLNHYFPKFLDRDRSPIKFGLVCASVKFPFFEIWRILEEPKADIHIGLIHKGELHARINQLPNLLIAAKGKYRIHALYKLAEIARISESLAKLEFQKATDRADEKSYATLRKTLLPLGLGFSDILTFAKIIED